MRYRPIDRDPDVPRFGRFLPDDWDHLDRYPLSAVAPPVKVPVVIGVNWYVELDRPTRDSRSGEYFLAPRGARSLTRIRGGHAVCLEPGGAPERVDWQDFYNQYAEGSCFNGDVLIRMADGSQRRIQDVQLLEEVVTAEGRTGRVLQTMARPHSGPLVRVVAWGHSHLRCTPEHPILTRRGYVPAGELNSTDWIAIPRYLPQQSPTSITPSELVDTRGLRALKEGRLTYDGVHGIVETVVSALPEKIELSDDFGRLVGLYAAEGCQTANKVVWSYGGHELDTLVQETVDLVAKTLGAEARIQIRPNNSVNVVLYGKHWRLLFAALVPGTAKHGDKHLSRHATNGSASFLRALLDGWYDGDGHMRRRNNRERRDGVTVSHHLALDMHAISVACGLRPAIVHSESSMNAYAATRQSRWLVTFPVLPETDAPEEVRYGYCQCGCGDRVPREHRSRVNRYIVDHSTRPIIAGRWRVTQDDRYLWRRIREVVEEPFDGEYVYNLHIEGDQSYVAEGVGVHNCVGFAFSRCMSILNAETYSAKWLWDRAKEVDAWPSTKPGDAEGTSVRAAAAVLRNTGHVPWLADYDHHTVTERYGYKPVRQAGIAAYRWARTVDEVHTVLGNDRADELGAVPVLNSWGRSWPYRTWMPDEVLARLLREQGEAVVPTDR